MRKIKEISVLLVLLVVSFALFFVVYFPSPFVASDTPVFFDGIHLLKLFLSDKTFFRAIINTFIKIFRKPVVSSVVLIPLSCFILKNRIKFTRISFYLTAFVTSFIISIVYLITNVALSNLLGYIFFPMSIGFLCLIVFWILELFVDIIKRFIRKRKMQ